jgi:hypothetical protein
MNRWALIALVSCVLAAGCDDNDSPTTASSLPLVFTASLSPANEVPPVSNAESGGRGAAQVTFEVTRDSSNAITAGTATFHFQLTGFPGGTTAVAAHIHSAPAGVNGPIVVDTGLTAAAGLSLPSGTGEFTSTRLNVMPATIQAIVDNPAAYYFNVHSPLNPGGFTRGQLSRIQ